MLLKAEICKFKPASISTHRKPLSVKINKFCCHLNQSPSRGKTGGGATGGTIECPIIILIYFEHNVICANITWGQTHFASYSSLFRVCYTSEEMKGCFDNNHNLSTKTRSCYQYCSALHFPGKSMSHKAFRRTSMLPWRYWGGHYGSWL